MADDVLERARALMKSGAMSMGAYRKTFEGYAAQAAAADRAATAAESKDGKKAKPGPALKILPEAARNKPQPKYARKAVAAQPGKPRSRGSTAKPGQVQRTPAEAPYPKSASKPDDRIRGHADFGGRTRVTDYNNQKR
jgi:hypothetical protein